MCIFLLNNDHSRLAMIEDVIEVIGDEPEVEGHEDGANQRRTEEGLEHAMAVRGEDRHAITAPDTACLHEVRPSIHALIELSVVESQIPADYRFAIRIDCYGALEEAVFVERHDHLLAPVLI